MNKTYYFASDACQTEIEAETLDAACKEFADGEAPLRGASDRESLIARIEKLGGSLHVQENGVAVIDVK